MKQLICALLATLTLAGCGRLPEISRELPELPPVPSPPWERTEKEEGEKDYYLEITTPDGEYLGTVHQGEELDLLFNNADTGDQWVMSGERPDGLEPEYICRLWVQKTLLAWQDPADERGYEAVMCLTTFQGSNYVEETVNLEVLTSLWVPDWLVEDYLNFSCYAPEESLAAIRAAAGG